VVNLKIKKAPVERVIRIKGSPGYNQLVDSYGDYKFSVEYSDRFFDDVLGVVVTGNHEKVNRSSESFTGSYEVLGLRDTVTGVVPIGGTSIVVGNSLEDRTRSGASMTLDYDFGLGTVWLTNFYSLTSRNPFSTRKEYDPQNDLIRYTIRDQEIDLDGLSTALNGQISVWGLEMDWVVSRYRIVNDNSFDYTMTLDQGSSFDPAVLSVNDNTTYVPAARDSAHKLYLRGNIDEPNATTQTDYTAQYNIKVPFSIWYITGSVKAGGKYTSTDRDNRSSGYGALQYYLGGDFIARALPYYDKPVILTSSGQISSLNFLSDPNAAATVVDGRYRITPIYDRGIIKSWAVQQRPIYEFDRNALSENYDVKETVAGGYLMTELKYGTFATLLAGIRYELEDSWYKSVWTTAYEVYGRAGISFDTLTTRTNAYWFPHAHLKLQFTDWFDIRLSANRTLARPDFYWVSPWTRYDLTNARLYRGNPLLKDMKVANYNVSAFLYNNIFGFFGVSGFYKDIRDVFYAKRTQVYKLEDIIALGIPGREGGYEMRTYENAEKSEVRGVEVEWQTQLAFFPGIPEFLRGVVLNANYSRIWSKTLFPFYKFTATRIPGSRPPRFTYELSDFFREGPMPGQADEIINVSLGYDRGPFSARVSFSYQGPSINGVGEIAETDTWNQEFTRWDSTIKYRWTDWLALSLNLVNLSNQPDEAFFGSDRYQTSSFYYGMTGSASVEITL